MRVDDETASFPDPSSDASGPGKDRPEIDAPAPEEAVTSDTTGPTDSKFWRTVGAGLSTAGRVLGQGAVGLGESVAEAYRAIDPDLLRHIAQLPLMGLTYLSPGFRRIEALPDDGRRAVVFVHGLGGHRGNFLPMQGYFRVMGRKRAISVGFRGMDSIGAMADQLCVLLRQVVEVNRLPEEASIDLVCHSMGGIIARLALEDPQMACSVTNLVTLGTPHAGTQLARLLRTTKVLELRTDSAIIARLQTQLPWPGPPALPRLTAVWSPADMVMMPPESARVEGARNVQVEGFSHFSWLVHPQAWKLAFDALEELAWAGPDPRAAG